MTSQPTQVVLRQLSPDNPLLKKLADIRKAHDGDDDSPGEDDDWLETPNIMHSI